MIEKEIGNDEDVFLNMVNEAAMNRPARVGYIVSEEEARRLNRYDREAAIREAQEETVPWVKRMTRILGGVIRGSIGIIFLAGAMEGLMHPAFAGVVAASCVAWGGVWYTWGYRHD